MPPLNLLIKPASSLCNMRCKYCFYADVAKNREVESYGIMSEETQKQLVKRALAYADGYCNFAFQGGEPTLAGIDFYRRQIDIQRRYNFKDVSVSNSIQTNGYLINEEWAKFFAKHNFLVGLSLDGTRDVHDAMRQDADGKGTFERVMETVALFERYGVEFNILTVVNRTVAQNAKKIYSFFRSRNFKYLQFIECLDPFDSAPQEYSLTSDDYEAFLKTTFDEYYRDFQSGKYTSVRTFDNYVSMIMGRPAETCGMNGVCTVYDLVEANGNVYPCDFYVIDRYLMGNVHTHTFDEMNNSDIAKGFVGESLHKTDECRKCKWYRFCRGGCKRNREALVDGVPGMNRFCEAYKGFFEYSYPRMVRMAQAVMNGDYKE